MSAQFTTIIQNLTAELDQYKRRLRQLERENEHLRQRLTAALTAAANSTTREPSLDVSTEGAASLAQPRTPLNQSLGEDFQASLDQSPGARLNSVTSADFDMGGLSVSNSMTFEESTRRISLPPQHGRTKSLDPSHFQSSASSANLTMGSGGATSSALVASLRRKLDAYERREVSWREQVSSLSHQLDTLRAERDTQVRTLQQNLEDIGQRFRESQSELLQQKAGGASTSKRMEDSFCATPFDASITRSPPTSDLSAPDGGAPRTLRQRTKSMVVLKKKQNSSSDNGELFAELPKDELEDVFATHASHVRTRSNNLVPISAITSGAVTLTGPPNGSGPTSALVPPNNVPVNPNQLGETLAEEPKDRRWYLYSVIRMALRKAVINDRGFVAAGAGGDADSSSAGAASSSSPRGVSVLPTLQGKSVSVINMMVKENLELYFYVKDNQVVMSDCPVASLPPFHKQNSDPVLLQSFSSSSVGTTSSTAGESVSTPGVGGSNPFSWLNARADQMRVIFPGPTLFSYIRAYLRFDVDTFLKCVQEALWRESVSPGKSDASMYFFGNFVIKSVKESEYRFLKDVYLAMFAKYVEGNPHTLISRFYSLFSVYWLKKGQRRHFVVMNNVFWTKHYINKIYDIKGSSAGRDADAHDGARTAYGALLLKDNDLPLQLIICGPMKRATLLAQLRSDTSFLASLSVVDYSCIIGIRTRVFTRESRHRELRAQGASNHNPDDDLFSFTNADGGLLSLPIYAENDSSTVREDTYYIGLIDVLQTYTPQKRLEHFAKGLLMDKHSISVVPPIEFSERLCKIIERITV